MKKGFPFLVAGVLAVATQLATAQEGTIQFPKAVEAGAGFSVSTNGSGKATLTLASPAEFTGAACNSSEPVFGNGEISNAGHYVAWLVGESTQTGELDVVAHKPANLSFLAKPSRLAVSQSAGISGVVYVFDAFHNLVLDSLPVTFRMSAGAAPLQAETVSTKNGVAWVRMDSSPKAGAAQFDAMLSDVTEKRIVQLIPGDPCSLRMDARRSGSK